MVNKYLNGAVALRGDIVSTKGGLYVVIEPAHSAGFLFLATIENPLGFTRRAPVHMCDIAMPTSKEKTIALDVLSNFP